MPANTASTSWLARPAAACATYAPTGTAACCRRRSGAAGSACISTSHLKRLRLISQLLERGYSSANIKELLEAWEQGRDLDHVLGLDQAIIGEWNLETPGSIGFDELQAIFGDELNDRVIDKAQALGLLLFDGERMKIPSPRLFQAGLELYRSGIPLERCSINSASCAATPSIWRRESSA